MIHSQRNERGAPGSRGAANWSEIGLTLTVGVSALALGGAHIWVVLLATTAVACCGALGVTEESPREIPSPAMAFAALGAYSLLQSIPLPLAYLHHLSAFAAEVWSRSLFPFTGQVRWGSLSLDPGASSVEAAKWFSYAIAFWLAAASGRRRGASPAIAVVFFSALLVAVATVGHSLLGATSVFGIYEPKLGPASNHIGPILNPNCLAGYLILGVFCGLGFALDSETSVKRWLWAGGTAVTMGVVILSGSRGGVVALGVGIVVFAAVSNHVHRRKLRRLRWYDWAGVISIVIAAALFSVLGEQDSWFELTHGDLSKLKMSGWVVPLLRDFPVFGIGRGAFESVFPAYKPVSDNITYANPENIVAQWLTEWGIGVALLSFGLLAWLLRPSRLGFRRNTVIMGTLVGIGALIFQNLVDFSLELFAPMLAVTVLLGGCWGESSRHAPRPSRHPRKSISGGLLVVLCFACVGLAFARGRWPVSLERAALRAKFSDLNPKDKGATATLWSDIDSAMQRHPSEAYFPRLGALLAMRIGNIEPMPWINRSLDRGPADSRTHWVLARALYAHGFLQQALLEARLSAEYDPDLAGGVGATVARWSPNFDDLNRAAPPRRAGSQFRLAAAGALDPIANKTLRESLIRATVDKDPTFVPGRQALASSLLGDLGTSACAARACLSYETETLSQALALERLQPDSAVGSEVRAQLYRLTGQWNEGDRVLRARCPVIAQSERVRCWRALFSLAVSQHNDRQMVSRAAQQLVQAACSLGDDCQGALREAGQAMTQLGNWPEALDYFQRAVHIEPALPSLIGLADAAAALGRIAIANRALELAARHSGPDRELQVQIQVKREALRVLGP